MSRNRLYFDLLARERNEREESFWTLAIKECSSCHGVGEIEEHTKEGNYYTCTNCAGKGYITL